MRELSRENVWKEHQDLESEKPILIRMTPTEFIQTLETSMLPIFVRPDEALPDSSDHESTHTVSVLVNVTYHLTELYTAEVGVIVQSNQNKFQNWQIETDNGRSNEHSQCSVHTEQFCH